MPEVEVGKVSDYFSHIMVAGVDLSGALRVGDRIHILGHTTDIEMSVDSMQINRADVPQAKSGDSVGIRVPERVRRGDIVYIVMP
jgi:translation elongation factor EF-Tu-like GTPase